MKDTYVRRVSESLLPGGGLPLLGRGRRGRVDKLVGPRFQIAKNEFGKLSACKTLASKLGTRMPPFEYH